MTTRSVAQVAERSIQEMQMSQCPKDQVSHYACAKCGPHIHASWDHGCKGCGGPWTVEDCNPGLAPVDGLLQRDIDAIKADARRAALDDVLSVLGRTGMLGSTVEDEVRALIDAAPNKVECKRCRGAGCSDCGGSDD